MGCDVTITFPVCPYAGLSDFDSFCCVGSAFSVDISVTGPPSSPGDNLWSIAGALPTGLSFTSGFLPANTPNQITGTATDSGQFDFTISVITPDGCHVSKNYSICAIEISPLLLPPITIGVPIAVQFTVPACAGLDLTWEVDSPLPNGLTLDEATGIISGTPTQDWTDFTMTVTVGGLVPGQCSKHYIPNPAVVAAYWTLDEAAPNVDRADSVDSATLFALGPTAGGSPGLISNAVIFAASAGSAGFQTFAPVSLAYSAGDSWSGWGWFRINALGVGSGFGGPSCFFGIGSPDFITIFVGDNTVPLQPVFIRAGADSAYLNVSSGAWHFFHLCYNGTTQKYGYSIDNAAITYFPTIVVLGTAATGGCQLLPNWTGIVGEVLYDEIGIMTTNMLNPTQQAYLWNGGAGRTWPIVLP